MLSYPLGGASLRYRLPNGKLHESANGLTGLGRPAPAASIPKPSVTAALLPLPHGIYVQPRPESNGLDNLFT